MINVAGARSAAHPDIYYILSRSEANSLNESIKSIRFIWEFQCRLQNIQEAYIELEIDMAEFCLRFGTTPNSSISFLDIRPRLERRLLYLLSAIRAYHDHNRKDLKKKYGIEDTNKFLKPYSNAFDRSFEYRLLEKVRNIAQHSNSAVSSITFSRGSKGRLSVDILISKGLLDEHKDKLGKGLPSEIDSGGFENFDLKHSIRVYIGLLANAHDEARTLIIGKNHPIDQVMNLQLAVSQEADVQASDVTKITLWGMPGGDNAITGIDVVELQEIWKRAQRDNRQNSVGSWYYSGKINGHPKTFPPSQRVVEN